ncbi:hypothetical protein, partial [Mariniphaga sediminis]|uniref:hypothetical protein n=1 Tax=Mariniphaga sediminis TaxID=1628158 RepID=UPI0035660BC5
EAFRRDTNMVTFAAHLFIDAWPAGWMKTIMDVDRNPKKGFFAYREALKPTIVSLRSDRRHFYAGEKVQIESWVCHDPNTIPEGYALKYQLEKNGKVIASGKTEAQLLANSSLFQGMLTFDAESVKKRTTFLVRAALVNKEGVSVDQTEFELDVFPAMEKQSDLKVAFVGENENMRYLLECLDLNVVSDWKKADIIWISDFDQYDQNEGDINEMIKNGKRVILYNVPVGEYQVGNTDITVQNTSMGSYYFASPQTGHRYTKDASPFDFRMWYDEEDKYITPFLDKIVISDDWNPILATGNTNWVKDSGKAFAAAELNLGKGKLYICQIDLYNRLKTNPVAYFFVKNLIEK